MIEHDIEDMFLSGYGDSEESPVSYSPYEKGFPFFLLRKYQVLWCITSLALKQLLPLWKMFFRGLFPQNDDRRITFQGPGGNDITLHFPIF